ncbi:MAG TPA: carcinine hydrolase/isopenicillin-N N-acyltransferase family protein [Gemmataceae bacterium]|jgi:dipeptidase|nr:carcinine hydrolase/isopenicillin-N N-acyltransferase family protein [Gemmataceae bacterium]
MGGDLVVALGRATVDGITLFGQNSDQPARQCQVLRRTPGRAFAADEKVRTQFLELPQARQTWTVLGGQPEGRWGYTHGVNEHGLAAGCASLRGRLGCQRPGLLGTDLVRLALERCQNARQAVDLLTEWVECHGQAALPGGPRAAEGDTAFLVADADAAFVVEAAANHWVCQEILEVRAVSDLYTVHQDWDGISRGLAGQAIACGWWPADGSKLDFADALGECPVGLDSALRRWGRATLLLEQQNGHIDAAFVRRLLGDHYESTHFEVDPLASLHGPVPLCRHARGPAGTATAASIVTQLTRKPEQLPVAWCAFGPPCLSVYLPVFLDGDLPAAFGRGGPEPGARSLWWRVYRLGRRLHRRPEGCAVLRESLGRLQACFDQEAREFAEEGATLKQCGARAELQRLASLYMTHSLEQFDRVLAAHETLTAGPGAGLTSNQGMVASHA